MSSSHQQASQEAGEDDPTTPRPRPRPRVVATMSSLGNARIGSGRGRQQGFTSSIPVSTSTAGLGPLVDEDALSLTGQQSGIPRSPASQDLSSFLPEEDGKLSSEDTAEDKAPPTQTTTSSMARGGIRPSHNHPGPLNSNPVMRTSNVQASASGRNFTSSTAGPLRPSQTIGNIPTAASSQREGHNVPQTLATVPETSVVATRPRFLIPPDSAVARFRQGNMPPAEGRSGDNVGAKHRDSMKICSSQNVPRCPSSGINHDDGLHSHDVPDLPVSMSTHSFQHGSNSGFSGRHTQQASTESSLGSSNPLQTSQARVRRGHSSGVAHRDRPVLLRPYEPPSGTTSLSIQQVGSLGVPPPRIRRQSRPPMADRDDVVYLPPATDEAGQPSTLSGHRQDEYDFYRTLYLPPQTTTSNAQRPISRRARNTQNMLRETSMVHAQRQDDHGSYGTQYPPEHSSALNTRHQGSYGTYSVLGSLGRTYTPNAQRQDSQDFYGNQHPSEQTSTFPAQRQDDYSSYNTQNQSEQAPMTTEQTPAVSSTTPIPGQTVSSSQQEPIAGSTTPTPGGQGRRGSLIPRPALQSNESNGSKGKKWSGFKIPKSRTLTSISSSIAGTFSRSNLSSAFGRHHAPRNLPTTEETHSETIEPDQNEDESSEPAHSEDETSESAQKKDEKKGLSKRGSLYIEKNGKYWAGRFVSVNDRLRNEALQSENLQAIIAANVEIDRIITVPEIPMPPPPTGLPPDQAALVVQRARRENRHRRVFAHLQTVCRTRSALDGLWEFQLRYARTYNDPTALPPGGSMEVLEDDDDLKGDKERRKKKEKNKWIPPSLIGYDPHNHKTWKRGPGPGGPGSGGPGHNGGGAGASAGVAV
ncbi:hypothetical protein GGS26DRAFT_150091 [Hypomontagnella submonticulosa]|nr:hypothetical protein GGS26DRAFT_150091 [Hypomontagnella submonticulosa]